MSEIVTARRAMFAGPRFVLMGYDAAGKEVFGIGCHPKNGRQWMRSGSKNDLARVKKEYQRWKAEGSV